jgi:CRISPR/Cas system-associated exonuclease Cas4 (RecB family)
LHYKTSASLKIDTIKNYEDSRDFQLEFYYLASSDRMIKDVGYYSLLDSTIKNEVVLKEKLELLDMHFKTLKTTRVDFKMTNEFSDCQFCAYKTICGRD